MAKCRTLRTTDVVAVTRTLYNHDDQEPPYEVLLGHIETYDARSRMYYVRCTASIEPWEEWGGVVQNDWFSANDVVPIEDYVRERTEDDPDFASSPIFQKYAPRDLKDRYPEAGADFGFFDTRRTKTYEEFVHLTAGTTGCRKGTLLK